MRFRVLLYAAFFVCASTSVRAFESDEHQKLGNLALHLALAQYALSLNDQLDFRLRTAKDEKDLAAARQWFRIGLRRYQNAELLLTPTDETLSYGEVVACIDYFLYPAKLIAQLQARAGRAQRLELPNYDPGRLFEPHQSRRCTRFGGDLALASHTNHSHFQHGAIVSYRALHEAAVSIARRQVSRIYEALVTNAMADHFLTDLFAPGHILTARERLSDVYATQLHDTHNARGLLFRPANTDALRPLAEVLCQPQDQAPCIPNQEVQWEVLAPKASDADIRRALEAVMRKDDVLLRGDARLWGSGEQLKQRVLMLLVQARSILDVLEEANSFDAMEWFDQLNPELPQIANLAFGEYELRVRNADGTHARKTDGSWITAIGNRDFLSPILGLSAGRESMTSGAQAGRYLWNLEISSGFTTQGTTQNHRLALGIAGYTENDINGSGPTARYIVVWPSTEVAGSVYGRWLSYPTLSGDTRRFSFGLRMDSGFSSFFTVFLGAGRDYATAPDHSLGSGTILFAGLQFQLPWSRIQSKLPW